MPDGIVIQSHKGPYRVAFEPGLLQAPEKHIPDESHLLMDSRVAQLYREQFSSRISHPRTLVIEATEENKSIERVADFMRKLVGNKVRRSHTLIAIGGGIIQDITCFIASTLLRGLEWRFVPTTLLAQADSCIGSKSSINLGSVKNILGTFNPPREVLICPGFLKTLDAKDIRSGIGEIIKVHAIDSAESFDRLSADYERLSSDERLLQEYIRRALLIKQRYIEADEFDLGIRNIFNYGHSFGHAIESATGFAVPHGIAVTMGMEVANRIAALRGLLPEDQYRRMHPMLVKNYGKFADVHLPVQAVLDALTKDKKNTSQNLVLILPTGKEARISRVEVGNDMTFREQLESAIAGLLT